jgi:DNA-binding NarL/FixJ family response regulator
METTSVSDDRVHSRVTIDILLVDEQRIFREGLRKLFEGEPGFAVVGDAADPDEAVRAIEHLEPDIVIVSLSGRLLARMQTLRELRLGGNHVRTIMLTTSMDKTHVVQAQQHGVSGILLKETSPQVLYESVRSVAAGYCWLGWERQTDLIEGLRHLSSANENPFGLTLRELEIADAVRRGDTNRTIGRDLSITADTVKHHLTRIFAKIGVCNRLQLAMFAQNHALLHDKAGAPAPRVRADVPASPSRAAVHHPQRDREQQEPHRAAPESDRFQ